MKRSIKYLFALGVLVAISAAFACPNPSPGLIQSPFANGQYDPEIGVQVLATIPGSADDPWPCNCSNQLYKRYRFQLVNVTNNNTVVAVMSNFTCPDPGQVGFDGIDQWSTGFSSLNGGTTYRVELCAEDATTSNAGSLADCVTFTTND